MQRRGNCWYLRIPTPPPFWGWKGELVYSLRTPDLATARALRDKYVMPLLAESNVPGLLKAIARAAAAADESAHGRLTELQHVLTGVELEELTLRDAVDAFVSYLRSSGSYAGATMRKYTVSLEALCRIVGEGVPVTAIDKADAVRVRDELLSPPPAGNAEEGRDAATRTPLSARSVEHYLMNIRRMFQWLIDEGRVARADNPFKGVRPARVRKSKGKRCPTLDEAEQLMVLPGVPSIDELTWAELPYFGRYTGCRAGELAQLRAQDVVQVDGIRCLRIMAHGEGRSLKTEASERMVPVADKLVPHLDAVLSGRRKGRLFDARDWEGEDGTRKFAHGFLHAWNRRAKKVAPDLSFHCWRTYANDSMASASVDILDRERILGHKSTRTQAAYTPQNLSRLKVAVDSIP